MSTPPFIPSGPLPALLDLLNTNDATAKLWGARPSRALVVASRDDELPGPLLTDDASEQSDASESPSRRGAATSARDGRAPQTSDATPAD